MKQKDYCPYCMGTGIDAHGNPCSCKINVQAFYDSVACLEIPEQYQGISFSKVLVPRDLPESYAEYLQKVHDQIAHGNWHQHNTVICSPIGHSKTILAYSCIEALFRHDIPVFPVYDVLELKRIMTDADMCRKQFYEVEEPERVINVGVLFVKIPRVTSWEVYDSIALLLDRRVRRGNSTIFLYDGSWNDLIYNDRNHILSGLMGDGSYNTLEVKSYFVAEATSGLPEVQVPENRG